MIQDVDLELEEDRIQLVDEIARDINEFTAQFEHDERFKDILIRIRSIFRSKYFSQKFDGSTSSKV